MPEPTFLVDKVGLAKLVADRPKSFILYELIQNAWDEATTKVDVRITRPQTGVCQIIVSDDSPEGFADLTHAYTLFAESKKKNDPTKRGRFNLGEKLVIALAREATIITTKGRVQFTKDGRTQDKVIWRDAGTEFIGTFRMTVSEQAQMLKDADMLIPPRGIETRINGALIGGDGIWRTPIAQCEAPLPTVHADADGNLRPTRRRTSILFHAVGDDEKPMLYELGIPVVSIDCGFHVNVQQKVPLNSDRDNVTPAYLREIQTVTLNHMAQADLIKGDDATKGWVNDALESRDVEVEAVKAIITARYGDKVVIFDPSDREGTDMAVAAGYTVLPPRTFSHAAWTNVKASGVRPAGQVTPSPKVYAEHGRPENVLDPISEWTPEMHACAHFMVKAAERLLERRITVTWVKEPHVAWLANFGPGSGLTINRSKVTASFFSHAGNHQQIELMLHEFAHERISNHLSDRFADEVARLATKLILWLAGHGAGEKEHIRTEDL